MERGIAQGLVAALVAAVLMLVAVPARAWDFPSGSTCHAAAASTEDYAALAMRPGRWTCTGDGWSIRERRAFVRFDLGGTAAPAVLATRLTQFAVMEITVVGADGRTARRALTQADMRPGTTDWVMRAPLPRLAGPVEAVIVRVDAPRHAAMLSDMRLESGAADTPASLRHEMLIAMLCGALCLPLFFNLAFYRVLRERFLLWHGLSTVFMLGQTAVTSGLINRFAVLSLDRLSWASAITLGGGLIAAAAFAADLIEQGKLDPVHRRLLRGVVLWVGPWTAFYALAGGGLRPLAAPLYLASFLPLMGLFAWTMIVAWRRGSRAVKFQVAAWLPMMLMATVRIASVLGVTDAPLNMMIEQHMAMGLEVLITFLGVVDRLAAIRRERDHAIAEIRVFEDRVDRDPLTGLLNRGAIERRFPELHSRGFRTMALIDLDLFKQVNDTYGHVVGDDVLRATALAFDPDEDTIAVRMGGEEFLLLMRGHDLAKRAEWRRQSISTRIAVELPTLDRTITASMGLVEQASDSRLRLDFATLYAKCDRLLYDAKNAGRNRTMSERIQAFGQPPRARAA